MQVDAAVLYRENKSAQTKDEIVAICRNADKEANVERRETACESNTRKRIYCRLRSTFLIRCRKLGI